MEEQVIIEIWDLFKEYIPAKQMDTVSTQFINFLADHEVDDDTISSLQGLDNNLDTAIKDFLADQEVFDDSEEEEDYEDEDY
jgi:hypothetical protein